jgi:hypothetical protein
VNSWLILTGLVLAVAIVLVARAVRPGSGRRRGLAPVPVEALDKFEADCFFETRPTVHVRFRLGGAMCLECRNTNGGVS